MRSAIVDPTFADPEMYLGIELWVALYAYTLQIYYDFSAYTDIAIGSALFLEYVFRKISIVRTKQLLSLSFGEDGTLHYLIGYVIIFTILSVEHVLIKIGRSIETY